jgi:Flp pilus assembly protein TadD
MPYLSWQTIVVGDPLAAPFSTRQLTDAEIHNGIDEATGLPGVFMARRLDLLARNGLNRAALILALRVESLSAGGRITEVEDHLLRAAELEPRLTMANMQLASMYEVDGAHDKARARYERILAIEPDHVFALNNLAYSFAIHAKQPAQALPLAERAFRLNNAPVIADTLGWIHHLLGDNDAASKYVELAVRGLPDNAEVLLHAAVVRAALGDVKGARTAFETAHQLDPAVAQRPETKALETALGVK